ncbi:nonribosomal peptide synthetase [Ophiostoma piceae UAMH 11346]|uniref:Nonribosomal peptide synthetase n=1 Tax=Ophiostoma piceae (strain UAMH 11346) TaxID=1262450 RepID=S3CCW1_OPHP1|nr:nonribosomal peptide synthetase [Ophiostoma piceae UAMH 11346]
MGSHAAPTYGRRLLFDVLDETALADPTRTLAIFPRPGWSGRLDSPEAWQKITAEQAARAVNRLAHAVRAGFSSAWLIPQVDLSGLVGPTIAYIGPNDFRYILFVLAVSKAGGQALLVSPRNTTEGQVNLFTSTGCRSVWVPAASRTIVESWPAEMPSSLQFFDMPDLDILLADADDADAGLESSPFPSTTTFSEAATGALVILHTSGTTGLPKPIVVRHGMWACFDAFQGTDEKEPMMAWLGWKKHVKHMLITTPFFHTGGLATFMTIGLFLGMVCVLPPSDRPVSSVLVEDLIKADAAEIDGAIMTPYIIEEMAKAPSGEAALLSLNLLVTIGGSLAKKTGDQLAKNGLLISNTIASTEAAPYPLSFQEDMSLWDYFIFRDDIQGYEWRPVPGSDDSDDLFELFIVRKTPHDELPGMQIAFWTFPELDEWATRDLYQRHPTKKNHWKYYTRRDNIIVFSNGEKLNPEDIETSVSRHPDVRGALVLGAGRFQAGLLIEANDDSLARYASPSAAQDLIDEVWPAVEAANNMTVAHGRIARPLILLADPAKPFPRAGKGTIQRPMTVKLYEREINELYRQASASANSTGKHIGAAAAPVVLDTSSEDALAQGIRGVFVDRLGASPHLAVDADFFTTGAVDSLQVMNAIRLLDSGLAADNSSATGVKLSARIVYGNPTPAKLAAYILSAATTCSTKDGVHVAKDVEDEEIRHMQVLVDRYTADLDKPLAATASSHRPPPRTTGQTILVTGTTGSLGSYIMDSLLHNNADVSKVIAVNRDADGGRVRDERLFISKGFGTAALSDPSRVRFLHANLAHPQLGLSNADYNALLADVDRIVHCAWPVDFNYNVASFEPSIAGARHLADLAAAAQRHVPLLFVSSISVVDGWGLEVRGDVPEEKLDDLRLAGMGYGRSKLVSSLILDAVSAAKDVPVIQVRLGQVGGPRKPESQGAWNRQELIPSVFASSVYLGALPDSLGLLKVADWVPLEDAAQVMIELVSDNSVQGSQYYNLVNPTQTSWASLVPHIKKFYGKRIKEIISYKDWVARLDESGRADSTPEAVAANPAVKLIDRFQAMYDAAGAGCTQPTFKLDKTKERSVTLRNMVPVTGELMTLWCKQWAY